MFKNLISLLCSMFALNAYAEDWELGVDPEHSVGLYLGQGDEFSAGADVNLAFPLGIEFGSYYQQADYDFEVFRGIELVSESETLNKYGARVSTDPLATWSLSADYAYSGNSNSVETEDFGIGIQFYPSNWLFELRYAQGEVELSRNNRPDATRDRESLVLTAQFFLEEWMFTVTSINYNYDRLPTLNPSDRSVQILSALDGFHQLFSLLDRYSLIEAGYQSGEHFWLLGFADYKLQLTGKTDQSPYLSWDYRLNDMISIGALLSIGLDNSDTYGETTVRYHF